MTSFGMKANIKKILRDHGIKEIRVGSRMVKLQNAKTIDLMNVAARLK